ncbi:MAG: hypothetical protein U0869_22070 [Chloroflexota bacterium]
MLAFLISGLLFAGAYGVYQVESSPAAQDYPGWIERSPEVWEDEACLVEHTYDYTLYSEKDEHGARVHMCRVGKDLCTVPLSLDPGTSSICSRFVPNPFAAGKVSSILIEQAPPKWMLMCLFPGADWGGEALVIKVRQSNHGILEGAKSLMPVVKNLPLLWNDNVGSVTAGNAGPMGGGCLPEELGLWAGRL